MSAEGNRCQQPAQKGAVGRNLCESMTGIEQKMHISALLTLDELAALLGRSPDTIKKDMRRNPAAVTPRLMLPQTRLLRWRACDVDSWLAQFVQSDSTAFLGSQQ